MLVENRLPLVSQKEQKEELSFCQALSACPKRNLLGIKMEMGLTIQPQPLS